MAISMLKIRRPLGRLIFNMGIAIPGKTVFLIETAPWTPVNSPRQGTFDDLFKTKSYFDIYRVIYCVKISASEMYSVVHYPFYLI